MEDFLDFIGSLYDDTVDALSSFWDSFTDWISDVWNWLNRFFYKAYECIVSWFEALGDWAEEELKKLSSSGKIVISQNDTIKRIVEESEEKFGAMSPDEFRRAGQKVKQYQDAEINGLSIDGNQITGLSAFDAREVQNPDEFRRVMEERDGLLVLKN